MKNWLGGGIATWNFTVIKTDLASLKHVVHRWPLASQKELAKIFCKEDGLNPTVMMHEWDKSMDRVRGWVKQGDDPNEKFDPLNPKLRLISLTVNEKVALFLEFMTDYILKPMIDQGESQYEQCNAFITKLKREIDDDASKLQDDSFDDAFEALSARMKGIMAFIDRNWGSLGSKVSHAKLLHTEATEGRCSLYLALTSNDFYKALVSEFWRCCDFCSAAIPEMRKFQAKLLKEDCKTEASIGSLFEAVALWKRNDPQLRLTQADSLKDAIVTKTAFLCKVVGLSNDDNFVAANVVPIENIMADVFGAFGDFDGYTGAKKKRSSSYNNEIQTQQSLWISRARYRMLRPTSRRSRSLLT